MPKADSLIALSAGGEAPENTKLRKGTLSRSRDPLYAIEAIRRDENAPICTRCGFSVVGDLAMAPVITPLMFAPIAMGKIMASLTR